MWPSKWHEQTGHPFHVLCFNNTTAFHSCLVTFGWQRTTQHKPSTVQQIVAKYMLAADVSDTTIWKPSKLPWRQSKHGLVSPGHRWYRGQRWSRTLCDAAQRTIPGVGGLVEVNSVTWESKAPQQKSCCCIGNLRRLILIELQWLQATAEKMI